MNIFTKVYGLAQQTSKLGSVLQRAFYGSSGRVTLFEQRNFAGRRLDLSADCQKLSDKNFPERCNSVQVESGAWVGYEQENFRGRQYLWDMAEKGEYNCYDKWCAQVDHVSSVRSVKQDSSPARVHLFERAGFSGKRTELQDDIPNMMTRYSLNRAASIRVLGGAWVVYQEPNYRGPHYVLEKRDYNNASDWGSQSSTVGSMRRVRFNN
ncbi:gamma-crystallin C-like [Salmo salar]|uniref:Gamma-crystallin C n=1 Tax=Salmo salar TaxID=8030 RepID=A0ABM3CGD6_SALSA|nr:gamma-crystallin C-like [Salmo trutta]XP_045545614.1 gamma-crystallin C [Salmo salar]XP_045564847.1 gamma-crystallin C-like [Salmo salar]|eukprot:XP_013983377.1 PREDICTED: gamma-crystallin C-like [Salmo salar]